MIQHSETKKIPFETTSELLTNDNFEHAYLQFEDRQAGVGIVYDPGEERYFYNAYCIERTLLKELMAVEYEFLDDALETINAEFSTWELVLHEEKKGCGSCAAKR